MKTIVIALGGNALIAKGQRGTTAEQLATVRSASRGIVRVIAAGHRVVVTHGNGPQVGFMLRAHELAEREIPALPLDALDAATQGTIGYMLQQSLQHELAAADVKKPVGTIITQVLVSRNDPAFAKPSKPIGGFYDEATARRMQRERNWAISEDAGRGWRRVVPSPKPISIVERALVRELVERGVIVIACGGGGVPVVRDAASGALRGIEAVIDKDYASCVLAREIGADVLAIATPVPCVYENFGKQNQRALRELRAEDARSRLARGEFPVGSMAPKIEAACDFVETGAGASGDAGGSGGREAVITDINSLELALEGKAGTLIRR